MPLSGADVVQHAGVFTTIINGMEEVKKSLVFIKCCNSIHL